MTGFSNYLEDNLLDHILRGDTGGTGFSQPAQVYMSMHTADPTDAGSGAEVSGGSYVRKLLVFGAAASGQAVNTNSTTFAGLPTCNVTHGALWDAISSGNMLFSGAFSSTIGFNSGDAASIAPGAIVVELD